MDAMQEKMDTNRETEPEQKMTETEADQEERKQEIKTGQEHLTGEMKAQMVFHISWIEDTNEKFEVLQKTLISRMEANQERIMVCLGKTEATDLKENPEEMQSKAEHQEVLKEDPIVKLVRGQKKWYRGQNLAPECHQKPKERTLENCGSQKKLAAADIKTTLKRAMVQGKRHQGKLDQGQGGTRNLERMDPQEETMGATGM
jgi:hypothetical protein